MAELLVLSGDILALKAALAYCRGKHELFEARVKNLLELDPKYATGHQWYAELLGAMDRHDEAVAEMRLAESLDPTPIIRWNLSRSLYHAGRYREAIAQVDALPADTDFNLRMAHAYKAFSLIQLEEFAW